MKDLKKKYRDRLETLKKNRAKHCDQWNDAQNEQIDSEIVLTAEFCRDLDKFEEQFKSDNRNKLSPISNLLAMIEDGQGYLPTGGITVEEFERAKDAVEKLSH